MTIRKIQWIESILFFIISNLIMLLGADFPPPIGFLWITFISAVLSILHFFYTGLLLKSNNFLKTFFKTILIFSLVGFLISILFVIFNFKNISIIMNDTIIWLFIITLVFGIYGSIYWLLNYIISKKIVK